MRTFIEVLAIAFTLEAALFLVLAGIGLRASVIAELAATKWDYNKEAVRSLSEQRADTWAGAAFLILAFSVQLVLTVWEESWNDLEVSYVGAALGLAVAVALWPLARVLVRAGADRTERAARSILETDNDSSTAPRDGSGEGRA